MRHASLEDKPSSLSSNIDSPRTRTAISLSHAHSCLLFTGPTAVSAARAIPVSSVRKEPRQRRPVDSAQCLLSGEKRISSHCSAPPSPIASRRWRSPRALGDPECNSSTRKASLRASGSARQVCVRLPRHAGRPRRRATRQGRRRAAAGRGQQDAGWTRPESSHRDRDLTAHPRTRRNHSATSVVTGPSSKGSGRDRPLPVIGRRRRTAWPRCSPHRVAGMQCRSGSQRCRSGARPRTGLVRGTHLFGVDGHAITCVAACWACSASGAASSGTRRAWPRRGTRHENRDLVCDLGRARSVTPKQKTRTSFHGSPERSPRCGRSRRRLRSVAR